MPELPEVKTVIKHLKNKIIKQTIIDVFINKEKLIKEINPEEFKQSIINQTIEDLTNVGKFILFKLTNDLIILSHLRMEGKYRLLTDLKATNLHDHIIFKLSNNHNEISYLIYNDTRQFGTFHLRNQHNYLNLKPLSTIGQEPHLINSQQLFKIFQTKRSAIKTVLLDQSLLAGLGNIYVNEVLWTLKINPEQAANTLTLDQVKNIVNVSDTILTKATELGGTTIKTFTSFDNTVGKYQTYLNVHDKLNKPCKRCFTLIQKKLVNQRGTYFCPQCQTS